MANYRWKHRASEVPVSADVAGREIARLCNKHGLDFGPAVLVDESRKPSAPLHPAFEWDDKRAAEGFRCDQARYLIRHIVVSSSDADDAEDVRAFVTVTRPDDEVGRSRCVTTLDNALADPAMRRELLLSALRELRAFEMKYACLSELTGLISAVGRTIQRIDREYLVET